ncbi:MAG: O-antigen ligase family protein, partial [Bacteroidia bacterium]|nr:O-antigen ligase family protein [Bacteroidia bacterium]
MSIAVILLSLVGLVSLFIYKKPKVSLFPFIVSITFYIWCTFGYFYSEDQAEALRKIVLKLPLLTLPLAYYSFIQLSSKQKALVILIFCIAIYLPAAVSCINYFTNKTFFDMMVLHSKPIPVEFGYGIHHIEFAVLSAIAVISGLYYCVFSDKYKSKVIRILFIFLTVSNFIFMHILSARTGLIALYAAVFTGMMMFVFKSKKTKIGIIAIGLFIVVPVAAYFLSGSLRNRVENTYRDLEVVIQKKDANEHSFAMRVDAWLTASDIIKQHPVAGVGIGDGGTEMQKQYVKNNSRLSVYNRKNPHNQFIECAVQSGLVAAGLLLLLILSPLFYRRWNRDILLVSSLILFLV